MPNQIELDKFCDLGVRAEEWFVARTARPHWYPDRFNRTIGEMWEWPSDEKEVCVLEAGPTLEDRFRSLADDWSRSTGHISSVDDLVSHPSYQEIVRLGWDVVPLLLVDLKENQRFWFPALNAITKLRPFDPGDAGNGRRMTDAWIKWGQRKGLI